MTSLFDYTCQSPLSTGNTGKTHRINVIGIDAVATFARRLNDPLFQNTLDILNASRRHEVKPIRIPVLLLIVGCGALALGVGRDLAGAAVAFRQEVDLVIPIASVSSVYHLCATRERLTCMDPMLQRRSSRRLSCQHLRFISPRPLFSC